MSARVEIEIGRRRTVRDSVRQMGADQSTLQLPPLRSGARCKDWMLIGEEVSRSTLEEGTNSGLRLHDLGLRHEDLLQGRNDEAPCRMLNEGDLAGLPEQVGSTTTSSSSATLFDNDSGHSGAAQPQPLQSPCRSNEPPASRNEPEPSGATRKAAALFLRGAPSRVITPRSPIEGSENHGPFLSDYRRQRAQYILEKLRCAEEAATAMALSGADDKSPVSSAACTSSISGFQTAAPAVNQQHGERLESSEPPPPIVLKGVGPAPAPRAHVSCAHQASASSRLEAMLRAMQEDEEFRARSRTQAITCGPGLDAPRK